MTDNQLAVLLESIALNLENEIHYLQEQLPAELVAYKAALANDGETAAAESSEGEPYFPCTELLWDFARKLRAQARSLENNLAPRTHSQINSSA